MAGADVGGASTDAVSHRVQSGAMARLDVPVSTTYITGTWAQVSSWLAGLLQRGSRRRARPRTL